MTLAASWRSAPALGVPAVLAAVLFSPSCSSAGATCDCADPSITIDIPADVASSVTSVSVTGSACTNVTPTQTNKTNGGTAYTFTANAGGQCTITVDYDGTAFSDTVTIVAQSGCCAGYYASPISAAQVDVPEPGDAG